MVCFETSFQPNYSHHSVECLAQIGQAPGEKGPGNSEHGTMRQILGTRAVHLLAFFILVYVGVEVTMGGMSQL